LGWLNFVNPHRKTVRIDCSSFAYEQK
jgi:hypothetical protein